jgi:hypothetical protein
VEFLPDPTLIACSDRLTADAALDPDRRPATGHVLEPLVLLRLAEMLIEGVPCAGGYVVTKRLLGRVIRGSSDAIRNVRHDRQVRWVADPRSRPGPEDDVW